MKIGASAKKKIRIAYKNSDEGDRFEGEEHLIEFLQKGKGWKQPELRVAIYPELGADAFTELPTMTNEIVITFEVWGGEWLF